MVLFGGGVEPGETEIEAAKRENKEELGYAIKNLCLLKNTRTTASSNRYLSRRHDRIKRVELHEGLGMKFFDFEDIAAMNNIGFNFKEL